MKKLIFIVICSIIFSSCVKDEVEIVTEKSYVIFNNTTLKKDDVSIIDGSMFYIVVQSFKNDSLLRNDTIDKLSPKTRTDLKSIPIGTTEIKMTFSLSPYFGNRYYLPSRFYTRGQITHIELKDNSSVKKANYFSFIFTKPFESTYQPPT